MCGPLNLPVELLLAGHLTPWVKQLSCGTKHSCQSGIAVTHIVFSHTTALPYALWNDAESFGIRIKCLVWHAGVWNLNESCLRKAIKWLSSVPDIRHHVN